MGLNAYAPECMEHPVRLSCDQEGGGAMDVSDAGVVGRHQLLTVKDVAKLLCLSRTQVYALLLHDELQSIKIGRSRRILATSVETFIERHQGVDAPLSEDLLHKAPGLSTSSRGPRQVTSPKRHVPNQGGVHRRQAENTQENT